MQRRSKERYLALKFNNESIYIANKLKTATCLSDFLSSGFVLHVLTLKAAGPGGPASP